MAAVLAAALAGSAMSAQAAPRRRDEDSIYRPPRPPAKRMVGSTDAEIRAHNDAVAAAKAAKRAAKLKNPRRVK